MDDDAPLLPDLSGGDFPLDSEEARCLGVLVEKAMTTPDQYPMTLNGVRVGSNQVSNRHPVVDYEEITVERALRRLADKGLVRFVHRTGDRVVKYKYAVDEALELEPLQTALVAVLLLRGAQTPGELRQRSERYTGTRSLDEIEQTLERLCDRSLLRRLDRRPGQKESRYLELLTEGSEPAAAEAPAYGIAAPPPPVPATDAVTRLESELADLRARFERLLESLGVDEI